MTVNLVSRARFFDLYEETGEYTPSFELFCITCFDERKHDCHLGYHQECWWCYVSQPELPISHRHTFAIVNLKKKLKRLVSSVPPVIETILLVKVLIYSDVFLEPIEALLK